MPYTERDDKTVRAEIESGEPAIKTGDIWSRYEIGDGVNAGLARLERQFLIIARHPNRNDQIVCEDVGDTIFAEQSGSRITVTPEFNLRRLFRPDGDWRVSHG